MTEFMYMYTQDSPRLSERISSAYLSEDPEELFRVQKEVANAKNDSPRYIKLKQIMIQALIGSLQKETLTEPQQSTIIHYLTGIDEWTAFELYLFGNTLFMLPLKNVIGLVRLMRSQAEKYNHFQTDNISAYTRILNNAICYSCEMKQPEAGKEMLSMFEASITHPRQLYERMKLINLRGLLLYCAGNQANGLELLTRSIMACKLLEDKTIVEHELNYLKRFLTGAQMKVIEELTL